MSVAMMSCVWKHSKTRLGQRLVLLALADFANDDGEAWPSLKTLAAKSLLSEREIRYALRRLERLGEIKTLRNKGPRGCHLYQITVAQAEGANCAPVQTVQGANFAGGQTCRGAKSSRRGAKSSRLGGHSLCPQTISGPTNKTIILLPPALSPRRRRLLFKNLLRGNRKPKRNSLFLRTKDFCSLTGSAVRCPATSASALRGANSGRGALMICSGSTSAARRRSRAFASGLAPMASGGSAFFRRSSCANASATA